MPKFSALGGFSIIIVLLIALLNLGGLWLIASGVTSGIKAASENCGQTYVIEKVVAGDWFCPVERSR